MKQRYAARKTGGVPRLGLVAVMLLGAVLRIPLMTDFRFHADEALFASLGRLVISGHDPLLSDTVLLVDKPPFFYYTLALLTSICWGCELTARLTGLFSSLIAIALTARLTRSISALSGAPVVAALIVAVSPMAVLFSATAFADPLMVMCLLAAFALLVKGSSGWAGLSFGLALASKQNAILFLPLCLWILVLIGRYAHTRFVARGLRFACGVASVVALMILWDLVRNPAAGFWQAGFVRNDPGRLIRQTELLPRLQDWWTIIQTYTPNTVITVILLSAGLLWPLRGAVKRPREFSTMVSLALSVFVVGYFGIHWLVAFPLFDRYFLPLIPLVAILAALAMTHIFSPLQSRWRMLAVIAFLLVSVLGISSIPERAVGGDHGSNDGIDAVAKYLNEQPAGTIVYQRSLGWLASYYFFDTYLVPVTIESPEALSADLKAFAADPSQRYLVLGPGDGEWEMTRAVEVAGYDYQTVLETTNRHGRPTFTVLKLTTCCQPDL